MYGAGAEKNDAIIVFLYCVWCLCCPVDDELMYPDTCFGQAVGQFFSPLIAAEKEDLGGVVFQDHVGEL